jgi:hypothetical protein
LKQEKRQGADMRIDAVGLNRPLSRMQAPIKKVAGVTKPLTMAVTELSEDMPAPEEAETVRGRPHDKPNNRLDTLGSEVDVWV